MKGRLPDFVIAAAPRSGTTSLARYLDAHPDLYIAPGKELRFFDDNYEKGIAWYAARFQDAPAGCLAGEASPWYMFDSMAPRRMARDIPGARIIVSLREPVDRLWSHFWMRAERGLETRSFDDVIASEFETLERDGERATDLFYVRGSLYAPHLRSLLSAYPETHVVIFEQLAEEPEATFSEICRRLGVAHDIKPANLGDRVNAYARFRSLWLRNLAKRTDSRLATRVLGRINTRSRTSYPPLPSEHRERLSDFFAPFNADLETLIGREIPEWRSESA